MWDLGIIWFHFGRLAGEAQHSLRFTIDLLENIRRNPCLIMGCAFAKVISPRDRERVKEKHCQNFTHSLLALCRILAGPCCVVNSFVSFLLPLFVGVCCLLHRMHSSINFYASISQQNTHTNSVLCSLEKKCWLNYNFPYVLPMVSPSLCVSVWSR